MIYLCWLLSNNPVLSISLVPFSELLGVLTEPLSASIISLAHTFPFLEVLFWMHSGQVLITQIFCLQRSCPSLFCSRMLLSKRSRSSRKGYMGSCYPLLSRWKDVNRKGNEQMEKEKKNPLWKFHIQPDQQIYHYLIKMLSSEPPPSGNTSFYFCKLILNLYAISELTDITIIFVYHIV